MIELPTLKAATAAETTAEVAETQAQADTAAANTAAETPTTLGVVEVRQLFS